MTIKIGIHGARGQMGLAMERAIVKHSKFNLTAQYTRSDDLAEFCQACDLIIDFSSPEALPNLLESAVKFNKKTLIGTTGLSKENFDQMQEASQSIAILHAANTSVGANLIIEVAGKMGKILENFDVEIIDKHHKSKKDTPSGTAVAIGRNIASCREQEFKDVAVYDRFIRSFRRDGEIGFSSLRVGSIVGEHEVIFAGKNEIITISTQVLSRDVFADGALKAAYWLNFRKAGLYSMSDLYRI